MNVLGFHVLLDATTLTNLSVTEGTEDLLGYTRDEFLPLTVYDLLPEHEQAVFADVVHRLFGLDVELVAQHWLRHKNRSLVPLELHIVPNMDPRERGRPVTVGIQVTPVHVDKNAELSWPIWLPKRKSADAGSVADVDSSVAPTAGLATEAELTCARHAGMLLDQDGNIISADESFKEICGCNRACLGGVSLRSLLDDRGRATQARVVSAIARAGSKVGTQIKVEHAEGGERSVGAAVVPMGANFAVACWW